mmetsp:Transcript_1051/g.919  ORF Transcript_1051/g.919 Transcript_1051/m.919 type:complete len:107 (+) Transcript_1051:248-568(+)
MQREFNPSMLKKYLYIRIVWDIILLIMNVILVIINRINFASFLFNTVVVVCLDGYFNFVVYGYFKLIQSTEELNLIKTSCQRREDQENGIEVFQPEESKIEEEKEE